MSDETDAEWACNRDNANEHDDLLVLDHQNICGYAVFGGCEGDDPVFIAWFADRTDAEQLAYHSFDDEGNHIDDRDVAPAILTSHGIVAASGEHREPVEFLAYLATERARRAVRRG